MISTTYIHEYTAFDVFVETTHHIMNDVIDLNREYLSVEAAMQQRKLFAESSGESFDEEYMLVMEEAKENVFARIGNMVIKVFDEFFKMIENILTSAKEAITGMKKKSSDQAIKDQMERDPEMAQKFINAVMSGNITCHDVKDMDTLLKEAQRISSELASGKINGQSFTQKMDDTLEKYEKRSKSIKEILGIAGAATSAAVALKSIFSWSGKMDDKAIEARHKANSMMEDFKNEAIKKDGKHTEISVWLSAQRKMMAALGKDYNAFGRVTAKGLDWLSNITNSDKGKATVDTKANDARKAYEKKRAKYKAYNDEVEARKAHNHYEKDVQRKVDRDKLYDSLNPKKPKP